MRDFKSLVRGVSLAMGQRHALIERQALCEPNGLCGVACCAVLSGCCRGHLSDDAQSS